MPCHAMAVQTDNKYLRNMDMLQVVRGHYPHDAGHDCQSEDEKLHLMKKPPRSTSTLICSVNANMKNYILKKVLPLLDKIRGLYCHLYILHIRLLCINKNI